MRTKSRVFQNELAATASLFGLDPSEILLRGRQKVRILARTRLCVALQRNGWSSRKIGLALDMHHTTILDMLGKVQNANT